MVLKFTLLEEVKYVLCGGTKKNCIKYYKYGNSQIWSMKGQEIVNTQIFLL